MCHEKLTVSVDARVLLQVGVLEEGIGPWSDVPVRHRKLFVVDVLVGHSDAYIHDMIPGAHVSDHFNFSLGIGNVHIFSLNQPWEINVPHLSSYVVDVPYELVGKLE